MLDVWAGIIRHKATKISILERIMKVDLYCNIFEGTQIPFIQEALQEKDPKHTSRVAKAFLEERRIYWWRILLKAHM